MNMAKRPLIQKGVVELEQLFDQRRGDPEFLNQLFEELSERKVQRANELRQRVMQSIGVTAKPPLPDVANHQTAPVRSSPVIPTSVETPIASPIGTSEAPRGSTPSANRPPLERPPITNDASNVLSA